MSRSFFFERIRINVEIFFENLVDNLGSSAGSLRKPLLLMVGVALVMTLRSARNGVQSLKGYGLTAGDSYWSRSTVSKANAKSNLKGKGGGNAYPAPTIPKSLTSAGGNNNLYGTKPGAGLPGIPASSLSGGASSGYGTMGGGGGGGSAYGTAGGSAYGTAGGSAYGSTAGSAYGSTAGSAYGSTAGSAYGMANSAYGGGAGSTYGTSGAYGTNGGAAPGLTSRSLSNNNAGNGGMPMKSTSELVEQHGGSIRIMDATMFRDFGGTASFYGQVETLQAFEGSGVVEKVLQNPGQGKVLVVDGGGNVRSAIFGKLAAQNAMQNGWRGVVIHGAVREADSFEKMPIGVKALTGFPLRGKAVTGSKGVPLTVGGLPVHPGMWIYCDKDGIVMSDQELSVMGPNPMMGNMGQTGYGTGGGAMGGSMYGAGGGGGAYGNMGGGGGGGGAAGSPYGTAAGGANPMGGSMYGTGASSSPYGATATGMGGGAGQPPKWASPYGTGASSTTYGAPGGTSTGLYGANTNNANSYGTGGGSYGTGAAGGYGTATAGSGAYGKPSPSIPSKSALKKAASPMSNPKGKKPLPKSSSGRWNISWKWIIISGAAVVLVFFGFQD